MGPNRKYREKLSRRTDSEIPYPDSKVCTRCGCTKPAEDFHKVRHCLDGLSNECRSCAARAQRLRREALRRRSDAEISYPVSKKCNFCGVEKSAKGFVKDRTRSDGLNYKCRECASRAYQKRRACFLSRPDHVIPYPKQKQCAGCRKVMPSVNFPKNRAEHDGLYDRCRHCCSVTAKRSRHKAYGLSSSDLEALRESQGGACAVCRTDLAGIKWCIDHDHKTGAVRGLLCPQCNTGLGMFRDSKTHLVSAIEYLERAA